MEGVDKIMTPLQIVHMHRRLNCLQRRSMILVIHQAIISIYYCCSPLSERLFNHWFLFHPILIAICSLTSFFLTWVELHSKTCFPAPPQQDLLSRTVLWANSIESNSAAPGRNRIQARNHHTQNHQNTHPYQPSRERALSCRVKLGSTSFITI
jgi:hypothetical protein